MVDIRGGIALERRELDLDTVDPVDRVNEQDQDEDERDLRQESVRGCSSKVVLSTAYLQAVL